VLRSQLHFNCDKCLCLSMGRQALLRNACCAVPDSRDAEPQPTARARRSDRASQPTSLPLTARREAASHAAGAAAARTA